MKPRIYRSEPEPLRLKQIVVGQYESGSNLTYSLIGLGVDGCVYIYRHDEGGWVPQSMNLAENLQ